MKNRVLHIVRKNTQLRASFIQNQIINHIDFEPHVIYYEKRNNKTDGGFADPLPETIPVYSISDTDNRCDKLKYKLIKKLGKRPKQKLLNLIDDIAPDIIHLHYATDAGIYLPELKNVNVSKVVSVYGYETSGFPRRFLGFGKYFLKKRTFKNADKIFAMSPDMEIDLLNLGCPKEKIIVHYYGTDVRRFYQRKSYNQKDIINFIIISGLEPQKGHIFLLKAFQLAYNENKNIRLTIYGAGSIERKIRNFISENNLVSFVSLNGKILYGSRQHLEVLRSADVFIHPSVIAENGDKEGIPGAIVEAMASGLPVISTYHAGIPYIIENDRTGILVKEWDIEALTQQILRLANNAGLRRYLGQNAQKYALENLDLLQKEKELEELYIKEINKKTF